MNLNGRPCYCNSGKKFENCCGSQSANRKPPYGLHIYNGLFSKTDCKKMVARVKLAESEWLTLRDVEASTLQGKIIQRRDPNRVAKGVDMLEHKDLVLAWLNAAYVKCVEPAVRQFIDTYEAPQLLKYGVGGLYASHSDSEEFDQAAGQWVRRFDRDISVLIYLNDKFKGGGLHFGNLNYTYQPKAGDIVFFPSHNLYVHESVPIERGVKYAMVSWATVSGKPRVGELAGIRIEPQRG